MKESKEDLGLRALATLAQIEEPSVHDYVFAVSEYVLSAPKLSPQTKKAAQIRLSGILGQALAVQLAASRVRPIKNLHVGERKVAGALRTANADVSESHPLDGLRLAVEIKPINLAVGRAIWNRFGDIRTFAVNLHLKFPFAVVGGLLTIPTIEIDNSQEKDTTSLVRRAINRLIRAGGRQNEADAPHLLEAVGVLVYEPRTATIVPDLPSVGSGLRWEEFVETLSLIYDARFED
jgi:hypothetical protein